MAIRKFSGSRLDYRPDRDDIYLETGHDFFRDCPAARNTDLAKAIWQEHGHELNANPAWFAWKKFGPPKGSARQSSTARGTTRKDSK